MHHPYQEILKHLPDFRVKYRFFTPEEGGRWSLPSQGYRSDFDYAERIPDDKGIYMIWPEFEDETSQVITDNKTSVPTIGTARMWVVNPEMRNRHQQRVKVGTKGYFMEGERVATCEVIELVGLLSNPVKKQV